MMKRTTFGFVDPKKTPRYAAITFLISGVILLVIVFAIKSYQARALADSIALPAEVIRVDSRTQGKRKNKTVSARRRLQYRPVFRTTAPSGEVVVYESQSWRLSPLYDVGDRVTGLYRAETGVISTAEIRKGQAFLSNMLFGMSAIFIALGIAILKAFKTR